MAGPQPSELIWTPSPHSSCLRRYSHKLDRMLSLLESHLQPIVQDMVQMREGFQAFVDAIYCSMHRMPMDGVAVESAEFVAQLERAMHTLSGMQQVLEPYVNQVCTVFRVSCACVGLPRLSNLLTSSRSIPYLRCTCR